MDMKVQFGVGIRPACWVFVLIANQIVNCQLQAKGTSAPSSKPMWQTPSNGWSQFSNKIPWTTNKFGSTGLKRKTSSRQNIRSEVSQTTVASNPLKPVLTSAGTWGEAPQPSAVGIPGKTDLPVSGGIPAQPSITSAGIPVQPSKSSIPVSQGIPVQPSKTSIPVSQGIPVQPGKTSIPVSQGIPVQPGKTSIPVSQGLPVQPGKTSIPVSQGIPVQPSKTSIPVSQGVPVQPSKTSIPVSQGLPVQPSKTSIPVSRGLPVQPSRTAVPQAVGIPIQRSNTSIPVSQGVPEQPSKTVVPTSVGSPAQPSETAVPQFWGTPVQINRTTGKTVIPQPMGAKGLLVQPSDTAPVSRERITTGLGTSPVRNSLHNASPTHSTWNSGQQNQTFDQFGSQSLHNVSPTHSTWNSGQKNQSFDQFGSQSVNPSRQPQVWRTDPQNMDTQTEVQSDPQITDVHAIQTWTRDQQNTDMQRGGNSSPTNNLNDVFASMLTTVKPAEGSERSDVAGMMSSEMRKDKSLDSSSVDDVATTARSYDDRVNVFTSETQSTDDADPSLQNTQEFNTSSESNGQPSESYQSIDTNTNITNTQFGQDDLESGSDASQMNNDGIYNDTEYDETLTPMYYPDYGMDDAEMNLTSTDTTQSVHTEQGILTSTDNAKSVETAQGTLLITKIKDLHDSDLESDLVYKAMELSEGEINSTDEKSVSTSLNQLGNETVDGKNVLAGSHSGNVTDLGQFHVPDDDCLYDVVGASGSLKFPDGANFPISSNKEFVTCRLRVRVPDGPNIKVFVERLALSLGVEQLEIAVGMDGELKRRVFTGSKIPRDLVVRGTKLWLTARVRNDNYDDKIVLSFAETAEDAVFPKEKNYTCGAILTDMSGNITSPGYPDRGHYENNQECIWYIVAPTQSVIRLTVHHFSTDVYDHVTMGIGLHAGASNSKLLTLYGHLQEERETVIPANSLWVHFVSDDSDTDAGFLISYTVLPREKRKTAKNDICNSSKILMEEEGLITSVDYPQLYPINSECSWFIQAPPQSYVNITFFDLFVEDGRDFVLIGEGTEIFGGPFMTFTGNSTGVNPVRLDSSDVWVHFTSDHLNGELPYRGFSLSYQVHFHEGKEVADGVPMTATAMQTTTSMTTTTSSTTTIATTKTKTTTVTSLRPDDEDNMVLKNIPMNDQGKGQVITIPLEGVKEEQFNRNTDEFRAEMARLLNELCTKELQEACTQKRKLTAEDISLVGARPDQGRLLVEVRVEADVTWPANAMAATDYEELERLFHSDLQSLDLQDEDAVDAVSSHLPEWLIGVIVVVILLIIAFFAMVIYSLMKERKKNRAGSYGGTTSAGSVCEDLEVGKADGNIRITAFSLEQGGKDPEGANGQAGDGANGAAWTLDSEVASTLQRRQHGVSGCMNPAFIDDDAEKDDGNNDAKKEDKASKANGKAGSGSGSGSDTKSNKSAKSGKNNAGEELEMNGKVTAGKGQGQENGSAGKQLNNLSKDTETTDEETAIDDAEDGERAESKEEGGGTKDKPEGDPEPSTSGGGPRQLEVVVDRDPSSSDPNGCVMVHMDKDNNKQGGSGNEQESSTDEKEDGPGMSTNL